MVARFIRPTNDKLIVSSRFSNNYLERNIIRICYYTKYYSYIVIPILLYTDRTIRISFPGKEKLKTKVLTWFFGTLIFLFCMTISVTFTPEPVLMRLEWIEKCEIAYFLIYLDCGHGFFYKIQAVRSCVGKKGRCIHMRYTTYIRECVWVWNLLILDG